MVLYLIKILNLFYIKNFIKISVKILIVMKLKSKKIIFNINLYFIFKDIF